MILQYKAFDHNENNNKMHVYVWKSLRRSVIPFQDYIIGLKTKLRQEKVSKNWK